MNLVPGKQRDGRYLTLQPRTAFQEDITELFDRCLDRTLGGASFERAPGDLGWPPQVDTIETAEDCTLRLEVASLKPDDIEIGFSDGVVTIRGEKTIDTEGPSEASPPAERTIVRFVRRVRLYGVVDPDTVVANLKDGILTVTGEKGSRRAALNAKKIVVRVG